MPTFTMELKTAIDLKPSDWSVDKWLGLDDYPLFGNGVNNARRLELNQKIVREYWNCEIGMETISMFSYAVRRKMHKEMPLFNLLYESAAAEFDALVTTDMTSTGTSSTTADGTAEGTANSVNSNSSDSTSKSLTVGSDFPQSALSDRGAYATNSTDGDGSSTVTANADATDTSSNTTNGQTDTTDTHNVKGFQGNAAELIIAKRATFLNLDARVVDMLADCFMQVWSDGEQHLMNRGNY